MGSHFSVIVGEKIHSVSGTSASTPVMAGLVTLWNDLRLKAGKTPLGFLNPLLYQIGSANPKAFHDITSGDNAAARNGSYECEYSFKAGVGWDAVTGFGTPDFNALTKLITDVKLDNFNAPSTKEPEVSNGLPTYGIVLIVLGSIAIVAIVAFFVRSYYIRKQSYKNIEMHQAYTPTNE
ncbi:tripeptidyl-peptidase [Thraustotheca clavata]|uniref:subtilisin n=1 Tax=Thraustotheca clavata TaxID=74557 RepID=A0A1V9ZVN1_9STRA|nr:tripeptidyl-peptidase [Thraustotheca clavata]